MRRCKLSPPQLSLGFCKKIKHFVNFVKISKFLNVRIKYQYYVIQRIEKLCDTVFNLLKYQTRMTTSFPYI